MNIGYDAIWTLQGSYGLIAFNNVTSMGYLHLVCYANLIRWRDMELYTLGYMHLLNESVTVLQAILCGIYDTYHFNLDDILSPQWKKM